jgi:hypothetical protein
VISAGGSRSKCHTAVLHYLSECVEFFPRVLHFPAQSSPLTPMYPACGGCLMYDVVDGRLGRG